MGSPGPGFESRLEEIVGQYELAGRTELDPHIKRLLDPTVPLLPWGHVVEILQALDVQEEDIASLRVPFEEAKPRRRSPNPPFGGTPYVAGNGAAGKNPNHRSNSAKPRPALEDIDGYDQKPNPLDESARASTYSEFDDLLRKFWRWAGKPPTRTLARQSDGGFSHTTVSKLTGCRIRAGEKPFSVKLEKVIAFIYACGGTEEDQMRWVSAWRQIACSGDDE